MVTGNLSMLIDQLTFPQPQSPAQSRQYPRMMTLMNKCAIVHQNDSIETERKSRRNAQGRRIMVKIIIHDRWSIGLSGNEPTIKSPHNTIYRMHVINNSVT